MKQFTLIFKWLFFSAFVIAMFLYINISIQPELYYHLQQPSFLSLSGYFQEYAALPGGLAQYFANFLSQFFFFGWPGSIVILIIGFMIMFPAYTILKKYLGLNLSFYLALLPFVLMIALLTSYYFPFVVTVRIMLIYLAVLLYKTLLKNSSSNLIFFIVIAIPFYYIAGSGSLFMFSTTLIILSLIGKSDKKKILIFIGTVAISTFIITYLSYKYLFPIAIENRFFEFYSGEPSTLLYKKRIIYHLFCFSLPLITLVALFLKNSTKISLQKKEFSQLQHSMYSITIIAILLASIYVYKNQHKKNIILSDYLCYKGNFEEVINIALNEPKHDIGINYNYVRALNNTGQFLDKFFDYHQYIGADCLYPDKLEAPQFAFNSSDYYYDLGYISESRHWAFEALTTMPNNIRALKRLVQVNVIVGNYDAARAYLQVLKHNFLCSDFVAKYSPFIEDTTLASKDSEIIEKRSFMPDAVHASNVMQYRFIDLISKNPNNKMAFENMQMWNLLDHNLGQFMKDLQESCKFYKGIPAVYQQAILLYGSMTDINSVKHYPFIKEVVQQFMTYIKIRKEFNGNDEYAKESLSPYSNTYMYYVTYDSPIVTKATLVNKKEQYFQ